MKHTAMRHAANPKAVLCCEASFHEASFRKTGCCEASA